MPAWSRLRCLAFAALCGVVLAVPLWAEGIVLQRAQLNLTGELWQLSGGYQIELSPTLEDALRRGVQLTFVQSFRAQRPRSWWLAEDIAEVSRVIRLSYNALLRQYHATIGGHTTAHASLADALEYIGDFNDWAVLHHSQVNRKYQYLVAVRMALDVSQLPKPLQVNAVASQRWQLDSGWKEWPFRP